MNLLADENIDSAIVTWLRERHDVTWIASDDASSPDTSILAISRRDSRVLITSDLDFGEMVFLQELSPVGIVLLRLRAATQAQRLALLQNHWPALEPHLCGNFIVVANNKLRIRKLTHDLSDI